MPRAARKKSGKRIYHVLLRGTNQQQLFHDQEDYDCFTGLLDRFKSVCGYQLYAYCLMGNHAHLLIHEGGDASVGDIVRHIGSAYVYWYNVKYERTGHLFRDRFRSEPVEDEKGLLTVFRFILMNPVKAGICRKPGEYPYSSAGEYLKAADGITDTELIRGILGGRVPEEFICQENDGECLEPDETKRKRVTDGAAEKMIRQELGSLTPSAGKAGERQSLNASIRKLTREGISIRQLSRLTGISKKIIENAKG